MGAATLSWFVAVEGAEETPGWEGMRCLEEPVLQAHPPSRRCKSLSWEAVLLGEKIHSCSWEWH